MSPETLSILLSLTGFILAEARRAGMTNEQIKTQLGIDAEEFEARNPGVIPVL